MRFGYGRTTTNIWLVAREVLFPNLSLLCRLISSGASRASWPPRTARPPRNPIWGHPSWTAWGPWERWKGWREGRTWAACELNNLSFFLLALFVILLNQKSKIQTLKLLKISLRNMFLYNISQSFCRICTWISDLASVFRWLRSGLVTLALALALGLGLGQVQGLVRY